MHKCDGCRYKSEHQEMGFRPFGVCTKETDLINAEKNYRAETCPYKIAPQVIITTEGRGRTPYDDKIAEAARMLRKEDKPEAYLPQLYKIEGVDLAEEEPAEEWPKENPHLIKPLPLPEPPENLLDIPPEDRDELDSLYADVLEARDEMVNLLNKTAENLRTALETLAQMVSVVINNIGPLFSNIAGVIDQIIDLYPNKRVKHLAKHGKRRTRKKNINRIIKYFEREAKKRPAFAQE